MRTPFEVLGLPASFDIDAAALEGRHRELSRALHPDRHAAEAPEARRLALGRAVEVNDAYRVLRDPIRRAEALLGAHGVATGEAAEPKAPPDLLMEMMELREELAAARATRAAADVGKLRARLEDRRERVLASLAERFRAGGDDTEKLRSALPLLGELRYIRRVLDEATALEEDLTA